MKKNRLWSGLASICSFFLVAAILAMNCMMGYAGTVNSALGIATSKVVNDDENADYTYYESEYGELNAENLQKLIQDTYDESVLEEEEGAVLLRNENNALPLNSNETRITLFGHAVAQPLYKSSSAGSNGYKGEYCIDPYTAFKNAGFEINDTLYNAYKESDTSRGTGAFDFLTQTTSEFSLGEESVDFYTGDIQKSWEDDYNDVAVVMLAREAGEGTELLTEDPEGISQLALHQDEKDLLQMIKDSGKFKKTIVLLNSGNPMEVNWMDEYDVDACLWIGLPGQRGFEGVVNLLTGEANPSGSLTDTYAADSLSSPAVVNGSGNNQNWTNLDDVLKATTDVAMFTSCAEIIFTMLLLPKQLWYCIGIIILLIAMVILISVDNKDQRNHMDKYVDSHKKKIEVLDEVLESKFQINNKEKIEELMNIYQEYIDKETSKEKKRNSIILTIFSVFAGVLTISFENMGVIGIDFTNWLYVATFLLVFVATAGIWIYSYTFFDTLKRKYELMIKDLKDLLLLKY